MTDYGTIKIPEDDYDRHNARRKEMDVTWAEYIDGEAPDEPAWLGDIRKELAQDVRNGGEGLAYDDIVGACRKALREELPAGALQ